MTQVTYDRGTGPTPMHPTWQTVDFTPQRAGSADVIVDDTPRLKLEIVGWLHQELQWFDDDHIQRATGGTRVVPGYLGPAGAVVPLEEMSVTLTGEGANDVKAVRFAVQLNADADQPPPPVIHVTLDAPVDIAPKTRTVIRDDQGNIVKVVEEAQ